MRFCDSLSSRWLPHLTVACVLGTLMIYGCGPKPVRPPQSEQASVTGSVMFEGKPVTLDSTVVFYCKDKDATAAGKLDSLGKFSLKGAQSSVGIPVGRYVVMVSPPEPPMTTSAAADVNSPEYQKKMMQGTVENPEPPKDIPATFLSLDKSTLALELKAGPNSFDIDLAKIGK